MAWVGLRLRLDDLATRLPTVVIVSVYALLASLARVAISFSLLGLTYKSQPLALPDGSARAAPALMFAIITIFLYDSLSSNGALKTDDFDVSELDQLQQAPNVTILKRTPAADGRRVKVVYQTVLSQSAQDFAKQLLVLLGALVTAVSSFYFGANSVARAVAASTKDPGNSPQLTEVEPKQFPRNGKEQDFRAFGANLAGVTRVALTNRADQIVATEVASLATSVSFKLQAASNNAAGDWDLVVADAAAPARLPGAVRLTSG